MRLGGLGQVEAEPLAQRQRSGRGSAAEGPRRRPPRSPSRAPPAARPRPAAGSGSRTCPPAEPVAHGVGAPARGRPAPVEPEREAHVVAVGAQRRDGARQARAGPVDRQHEHPQRRLRAAARRSSRGPVSVSSARQRRSAGVGQRARDRQARCPPTAPDSPERKVAGRELRPRWQAGSPAGRSASTSRPGRVRAHDQPLRAARGARCASPRRPGRAAPRRSAGRGALAAVAAPGGAAAAVLGARQRAQARVVARRGGAPARRPPRRRPARRRRAGASATPPRRRRSGTDSSKPPIRSSALRRTAMFALQTNSRLAVLRRRGRAW